MTKSGSALASPDKQIELLSANAYRNILERKFNLGRKLAGR